MEPASSRHPIQSLAHTEAGGLQVSGLKLTLPTALLALCLAAAGRAEVTNTATFADSALQAKI